MEIQQCVREIEHPNPGKRNRARQEIEEYIAQEDFDLETKEQKQVVNKLKKIDSAGSRKLLDLIETQKNQRLRYETELFEYVKSSRIEEKEFYEAKWFYLKTSKLFPRFNVLVDCCAGNGLNGIIWALEGKTKKAILTDVQKNSKYSDLREFAKSLKEIDIEYIEHDVINQPIPNSNLVIAVHACNGLTDEIIERSIEQKLNFAVMPCCHSRSIYIDDEILKYFQNKTDVIDLTRVMYVKQQGYDVLIRKISSDITDKNRIIIGLNKL